MLPLSSTKCCSLQKSVCSQSVCDSQGAVSLQGVKASSSLCSADSWRLWQDQMLLLYIIATSAFLPPAWTAGCTWWGVNVYVSVSVHLYVCVLTSALEQGACEVNSWCESSTTDQWLLFPYYHPRYICDSVSENKNKPLHTWSSVIVLDHVFDDSNSVWL